MTEIEFLRQEIAELRQEVALLRGAFNSRPLNPIPVIGPGTYPPYKPFWEWRPNEVTCEVRS